MDTQSLLLGKGGAPKRDTSLKVTRFRRLFQQVLRRLIGERRDHD
jgi:hypothetical protein